MHLSSRSRIRLQGVSWTPQTLGAGQARASVLRSSPERTPTLRPSTPRAHGSLDLATNTLPTSRHPRHPRGGGGPTARPPGQPCVLLLRGGNLNPARRHSRPTPPGTQPWQKAGRPQAGSPRAAVNPPVAPSPLLPQEWPATGSRNTRVPPSTAQAAEGPETRPGGRPSCPGRSAPPYPLSHGRWAAHAPWTEPGGAPS